MKRRFSLEIKILLLLFFITTTVITINSSISYNTSLKAHETDSYNNLTAIREMKGSQIEDYLQTIRYQVSTLSESRMIIDAMNEFKSAYNSIEDEINPSQEYIEDVNKRVQNYYEDEFLLKLSENTESIYEVDSYIPSDISSLLLQDIYISNNPGATGEKDTLIEVDNTTTYNDVHKLYHPIIQDYLNKFGFYDIFLVDIETGNIIYSVFKEVDFATSLINGPYKETNFAEIFKASQNISEKDFVKLIDYKPYIPSYNEHASFISSPIYDGDKQIGVLVFQMPVDKINEIMTNHYQWSDIGLGESGETYIVGEDFTLRNQSRFLIEDKNSYLEMISDIGLEESVIQRIDELNNSIGLQVVNTIGTIAALEGKVGTEIFEDYRGINVLSSYRPLNIEDVNWVIMSEIDESEAFEDVVKMRNQSILLFFILLVFIVIISLVFTRRLTKPLKNLQLSANQLEKGNLDIEIKKESNDEIGDLAVAFDIMKDSIKKLITDLKDINQNLEIKVKERTKEIKVAYNELEKYKNQLEIKVVEEVKKRQETMKLKERMENELNIAHDIQMSMIPLLFPVFSDYKEFSIFADIKPAREVGGDFYDFYFIDESHICVVIGDVSGKGVPAALFMAVSKTLIKSRGSSDISPASILSYVNEEMSEDNPASMFVTVFVGVINLNSGEMIYTNAGHNPPYIINCDGKFVCLEDRHGPIIGAVEGLTYKESSIMLNKKDRLVLFTDGVTEAMNIKDEPFGEANLEKYIVESCALGVESLVKGIMKVTLEHEVGREQFDDITVLVFEFEGRDNFVTDEISIANSYESLPNLQEKFEEFCKNQNVALPIMQKFNIAIDDLFNNIISYAFNDDKEHMIDIHFVYSNEKLSITIIDDGIPFNPFAEKAVDTSLSVENRDIGGLGILLIKNLIDDYSYSRKINKNVVTLTMNLLDKN